MRITHLQIENYGPIESLEINVTPPGVCIFGYNGNAKSMICGAIQYALLGYNEHTDRRGVGVKELIRDGEKSSIIQLTLDGLEKHPNAVQIVVEVSAKKNEWCCYDTVDGDMVAEKRDQFWFLAGIDPAHAELCLAPVESVTSKNLSDMLVGMLGQHIQHDKVLKHVPEKHREWVDKQLAAKRIKLNSPEALEQFGKWAYQERADMNRDMKAMQSEAQLAEWRYAKQPARKDGTPVEADELPVFQQQLDTLCSKRDRLLIQIGKQTAAVPYDAAKVKEMEKHLKDLFDHEVQWTATLEESRATMQNAGIEVEDAIKRESVCSAAKSRTYDDMEALKRTIRTMDDKAACPTCLRPYDKKQVKETLASKKQELAELEVKHEANLDAHRKALGEVVEKREAVGLIRTSKVETAQGELHICQRQIAEVRAELAVLKAATAVESGDLQTELDTLDARIEKGKEFVAELKAWADKCATESALRNTAEAVAPLDWAVRSFKDGELTNRLITQALGDFAERVNPWLKGFHYQLDYLVEGKTITPTLQTPGSAVARRIGLCSRGQRLLAAWAVAMAFSESGAPVVLDNINDLDATNRAALLKRLAKHATGTIVLAGAWQQNKPITPNIPAALAPLQVAWVDNGHLTIMEVAA